MVSLLIHELKSRWVAVLGWGVGLAAFGAMYITTFAEVSDQMAGLADLSIYQAMSIDLGSFEGYMGSVVLQFLPLLLCVYGIITSTETLAGEEDAGTLELMLAAPLARWQLVTMKALAIGVVTFLILVIAGLGNALVLSGIKSSVEVDVTGIQLFTAILGGWPLTTAFVMIGLFLGASAPSRRAASLIMTAFFIISYFGESLTGLVPSLEGLKPLSLFHYHDASAKVFSEGRSAGDVWLLIGVAAVFFGLALVSFQRRDVTVGAWSWQRARMRA